MIDPTQTPDNPTAKSVPGDVAQVMLEALFTAINLEGPCKRAETLGVAMFRRLDVHSHFHVINAAIKCGLEAGVRVR